MTWSTFILVYWLLRHDPHCWFSLTDLKILYEPFEERDEMLSSANITRDSFFQEIVRKSSIASVLLEECLERLTRICHESVFVSCIASFPQTLYEFIIFILQLRSVG